MQSKLTLRIDDALIHKAKHWSKKRHISLSQTVATFFQQLPDNLEGDSQYSHGAWAKSLVGIIPCDPNQAPSDKELREEQLAHLEEKHL
jgi:hypothetical protein